jgi:hypothetical protein
MNVHKNVRLTPQGRALLVRRITEEGWRIVDAANAAGISVRQSCCRVGPGSYTRSRSQIRT